MNDQWIDVCAVGEINEEDVIRFDHGPHTYAIYRSADNEFLPLLACVLTSRSTWLTAW